MNSIIERFRLSKRFIIIFSAVLIISTIVLTIVLEDFVRNTIVRPLAYLSWLVGLILSAIPAGWFYTVVSLILILFAISSFRRKNRPALWKNDVNTLYLNRDGPIAVWRKRLEKLGQGRYANAVFAEQIAKLLLGMLATQNRMTQREVINACEENRIVIPDYVSVFILDTVHHDVLSRPRTSWYVRFWDSLTRLVSPKRQLEIETQKHKLDRILDFIESELHLIH